MKIFDFLKKLTNHIIKVAFLDITNRILVINLTFKSYTGKRLNFNYTSSVY